MTRDIEHYVRMGTQAERDYLRLGRSLFDRLIVNANLVEASKGSLAVFMVTLGKEFLVDPVTFAFALSPRLLLAARPRKDGSRPLKSTFAALAESYTLPPDLAGIRPLTPDDLNDAALADLTDAVLTYQRARLTDSLEDDAAFVYDNGGMNTRAAEPSAVFLPYFVDDFQGTWRSHNLAVLNAAGSSPSDRVLGVVAYQSPLSVERDIGNLVDDYAATPVRDFFVWPTDLDEHRASLSSLRDYATLVSRLTQAGKRLRAAYGGFFALLLAFRGLRGLSHGVGYGDKRDLEPIVGGGLPPARYYLRALRDGVGIGDLPYLVAGMTDDDFLHLVCDCTICRALVEQSGVAGLLTEMSATEERRTATGRTIEVPTTRVYRMTRFHFLENRYREVAAIRVADSFEQVASEVRAEAEWVTRAWGPSSTSHLSRWIAAAGPTS